MFKPKENKENNGNVVSYGYMTTATNNFSNTINTTYYYDYKKETKLFKLDNLTFYVQNYNNKKITISELVTTFITTDKSNDLRFHVGGGIEFKSLEDAKNYIIRIKKQYKKMKTLHRQLELDADFES